MLELHKWSAALKSTLLLLIALNTALAAVDSNTTKQINELYLQNINKNMDRTIDPCEDFFGYACGNWAQNYNSTHYVDMAGYIDYKVSKQLLELLRQQRTAAGIYEKLWHYYQSCEELKTPALNSFLKLVQSELNITWPIFRDDWNASWAGESSFNWLTTIAGLRWYGLNGVFLTQHTNVRLLNGSHYLLEIHTHQDTHELLEADVEEIFINFGMTPEESRNVTRGVMDLEQHMRNLTLANVVKMQQQQQSEPATEYEQSFKELTLTDLQQRVKGIDWEKYFRIILGRAMNATTDLVQTFLLNFEYFDELQAALRQSSNETIAYYIMLKFMYQLNEQLPDGHKNGANNMVKCMSLLRGYMPLAMNYLYEEHVYKYERNETDAILQKMFGELKRHFVVLIAENYLELDAKEQAFVLDELNSMELKIGNIPLRLTHQFVIDYYAKVLINATNFYANQLQLLRHHNWLQLERLKNVAQPAELQFYHHAPSTASSSSPVKIFKNGILVPYGYLQLPFYDSSLNSLYQYSLLGFILAHEIVHAFDLFHIVYDKQSNYNQLGVAVAQHFAPHLTCLSGEGDTLSENMADVSGLRLVYRTFFDGQNKVLDSQATELFFINSVQFLCANMAKISTLDLATLQLDHDMHDARVRQNWRLFEEFASTFKCKKDAKMYSNENCRLW